MYSTVESYLRKIYRHIRCLFVYFCLWWDNFNVFALIFMSVVLFSYSSDWFERLYTVASWRTFHQLCVVLYFWCCPVHPSKLESVLFVQRAISIISMPFGVPGRSSSIYVKLNIYTVNCWIFSNIKSRLIPTLSIGVWAGEAGGWLPQAKPLFFGQKLNLSGRSQQPKIKTIFFCIY